MKEVGTARDMGRGALASDSCRDPPRVTPNIFSDLCLDHKPLHLHLTNSSKLIVPNKVLTFTYTLIKHDIPLKMLRSSIGHVRHHACIHAVSLSCVSKDNVLLSFWKVTLQQQKGFK